MNKKVIFILCFVIIIVIGAVFLIKNIFENDVNNEELFYYPQNSGYLDVVLPTYKVSKNGDVEIKYVSDMCTFTLESQELENFKQDLDELRKLIHKPKNIKEDYTQEIYINNKLHFKFLFIHLYFIIYTISYSSAFIISPLVLTKF